MLCIDRLPAIPLVASDPYLSIWMPADTMTQTDTCHWSGSVKPIRGVLTVDGAACRFLGEGAEPEAALTELKVTATRTRFALKKAPKIKAFQTLNVRRCAAVWPSPPSACAGWSGRIPGSTSAGCCRVQRAFRIGRRAVCAAGKCRRRVPCWRAEPPAGSTCTAAL